MNGSKRYLIDTNILLRFLLGEPAAQAASARKLFARARAGEVVLEIIPVVVAETYSTLLTFYKVQRSEAAVMLSHLIQQRGVKLRDGDVVLDALARLQAANVAFVDALLAASSRQEAVPIASFDRDFDKLKDVTRYEPAP